MPACARGPCHRWFLWARTSFGNYKRADVVASQKLALGYHHFLSKRTSVYTTFAHDSKAPTRKNGYEVGLQHVF